MSDGVSLKLRSQTGLDISGVFPPSSSLKKGGEEDAARAVRGGACGVPG